MYDFKFTDIGEGLHEGQILKWFVKVGDYVKEGDTLVTVETDKVNAELPSPATGTIISLGKKEGETIHVGETVVVIDDRGSDAVAVKQESQADEVPSEGCEVGASVVGQLEVSSDVIESSYEEIKKDDTSHKRVLATPVARALAKDLGVDIKKVKGTGELGRILKEDILAVSTQNKGTNSKFESTMSIPSVKISTDGDVTLVPITKLRKAIVNSMVKSKQIIPHTTLYDEVVVDKLVDLRTQAKSQAEKQGIKLTYMAFIIKAVTIALKEFPVINASFDSENDQMVLKHFYNIGIAVDTPDGLIVPNIKEADSKSIFTLAKELRETADLTIARKIDLASLQNTTFTITNFGAVDLAYGAPIINHPEVGILGVGKLIQKPVVKDGQIVISYVLPLSIAVDHRVIDGADAGRFLIRIKALLNEPSLLLLA